MAKRIGWRLVKVVDNNPDRWGASWEEAPIVSVDGLAQRDFDVIVIASTPGKMAITDQLRGMGFEENVDFFFFADRFSIGKMEVSIVL